MLYRHEERDEERDEEQRKFIPHKCSKAENIDEYLRGYIPQDQFDALMQQAIDESQK